MADVNYLNPTSIAPKFGWEPKNALAGIQWVENRNDYRNLFEQQLRLQQMAEEERRMDLESKRKDVPLNDLKRTGQMENLQGGLPYQRRLGQTGAQAQVKTNQIAASPERSKFEIDKFKQGMNDNQWTQYQRSMSVVGPMVEQAMQIAKTQGPMAAQQWIAQNAQQAQRAGVDLPAYILDPKSWEPLYNAAIMTTKHVQTMQKVDKEVGGRERVANINAGASRYSADTHAGASRYAADTAARSREAVAKAAAAKAATRFSTDQRINALAQEIMEIPDGAAIPAPKINELKMHLSREYEKYATQGIPIRTMAPELQAQHLQNQQQYVTDKLNSLGIQAVPQAQGTPQPSQSGGQRPADPLGLR